MNIYHQLRGVYLLIYSQKLTHNWLHVLEGDWLLQHHLVKWTNEESFKETQKTFIHKNNTIYKRTFVRTAHTIQQLSMIHGHACHTANEFEVGQVIFIT